MNSDDMLPEEQDPEFEELITLLRQADLIDPDEQAQVIANARDRLFPRSHEITQHEMPELGSFPNKPGLHSGTSGRLVRLINVIAAVLVVAALIGSALLLFSPLREGLLGTTPSSNIFGAQKRVGPFEMSFEITPGPYFLDEVLEVDLSITNVTRTPYWLYPIVGKNSLCLNFLNIATTGGVNPHVTDFKQYWARLPWPTPNCNSLVHFLPTTGILVPAKQTLGVPHYAQLTSSGQVTLTAQLDALEVDAVSGHGTSSINLPTSSPWGTLHLFVSPHIPSDRQLSVKEQKTQVVVSGPPAVKGHLLGKIGSVCSGGSSGVEGLGQPTGTTVVLKPSQTCGLTNTLLSVSPVWWAYVVGAPGYPVYFGKVNGS